MRLCELLAGMYYWLHGLFNYEMLSIANSSIAVLCLSEDKPELWCYRNPLTIAANHGLGATHPGNAFEVLWPHGGLASA